MTDAAALDPCCADDVIADAELARLPIFPLPNVVLLPE